MTAPCCWKGAGSSTSSPEDDPRCKSARPPRSRRPSAAAGFHRHAGQRRRRSALQRRADRRRHPRDRPRPSAFRHHRLSADAHQRRPARRRPRRLRPSRPRSTPECPACSASISRAHILNVARKGVHDSAKLRGLDEGAIGLLTSLRGGKTLVTLAPEMTTPDIIVEAGCGRRRRVGRPHQCHL